MHIMILGLLKSSHLIPMKSLNGLIFAVKVYLFSLRLGKCFIDIGFHESK